MAVREGPLALAPSLCDRAMVPRCALDILRLVLLVLCTGALTACSDGGLAQRADLSASATQFPRSYRLGVGDKIRIGVYGEQDLSGQFEVNAMGAVPVPLIGEVTAKGLSLQEFRDQVQRRLADGYLKAPKVSVEILSYRSIYVHGEVKNAGEFAFKNGMRFRDAIAVAGGYTYRAQQSYLLVMREGEPNELRLSMPSDAFVLPGDNIRVPERFF